VNRHIGVADYKYVVLDDPTTRSRDMLHVHCQFRHENGPLTLLSSTTQQWIKLEAKKFAVSMLRWISTQIQHFRFKSGVAQGHMTKFRNFGTPCNFLNEQRSSNLVHRCRTDRSCIRTTK